MENDSRSAYLRTEVMTATPQKLRLMLIDGAIRFANQALEHEKENRHEPARHAVARCRAILAELLGTVNGDVSDVACRVRDLYVFLLKALVNVDQTPDIDKLSDIIGVLQVERETWNQVCREMPRPPFGHRYGKMPEVTAGASAAISPTSAPQAGSSASPLGQGEICLDA